jgi:2-keto-4-pentenoate hydratase
MGYKLGCTSRAVQDQLGTARPIFGPVFASGCLLSGARLSSGAYASLAVEGELAVRLADDGSHAWAGGARAVASLSDDAILAAVSEVLPVIELHHYVVPGGVPRPAALAATGGLHAGVVMGARPRETMGRCAPRYVRVRIDGELVGTAEPPWSLGSCPAALRCLAGLLAEVGLSLRPGQWILTGSSLPLFAVHAGNKIAVEAPPLGECCAEVVP